MMASPDKPMLAALQKRAWPDAARLAVCRSRINRNLAARERQIGELLAHDRFDDARTAMTTFDMRYGGLGAPQSAEWQQALDAHR